MDAETRYVLATHLTPLRGAQAARVVLRKAAAADKPPKTIVTDKLRSYVRPIKEVLPEAKHLQSEGFDADINNNLSERLQGTFRDRVKTLRGLDSIATGSISTRRMPRSSGLGRWSCTKPRWSRPKPAPTPVPTTARGVSRDALKPKAGRKAKPSWKPYAKAA